MMKVNAYSWIVEYKDGTKYMQFSDNKENRFSDINFDNLKTFSLVSNLGEYPNYILNLEPHQKLIFKRRNYIKLNNNEKNIIYILGWEDKNNPSNKNYLFIDKNKEINITSNFDFK